METTVDIPKSMWKYLDDYPISQPPEVSRFKRMQKHDAHHKQGVTPNFENPKLMGHHAVTIASGICMAFVSAFALARLYAKLFVLRCTRFDDCE